MDYIEYGPVYKPVIRKIAFRVFGIPKMIVVKTKKNGGLL